MAVHRQIIHHMDEAVTEVFGVMLNLECTSAKVIRTRFNPPPALFAIPCFTARILFTGTLDGACTLLVNQTTAAEFTAAITGTAIEDIPANLCADTAGELCNILVGSWKMRQPSEQAAYALSCPIVQTVTSDTFHQPARVFRETVTLLYSVGGHPLMLNLSFI
jgi:hypothetical protein